MSKMNRPIRVKVTRSYQITVPAEIREKLGISIGDTLTLNLEGGRIIVEKPRALLPRLKLGRKLSTEDVEKLIEEALEEMAG